MEIILQIAGFIAIAYVLIKFFPTILDAVFKLSVIAIGIVFVLFLISLIMSDWSFTYV
jgi:hypothetical protein